MKHAGDTENAAHQLSHLDGILIPYGEVDQSEDGKLATIKYARENNIPFFGIEQGMQMIAVEYARSEAKISADGMICILPEVAVNKDSAWRTGLFETQLTMDSKIASIYGTTDIAERHRHRYTLKNSVRPQLEAAGLVFSGTSKILNLIEAVELANHPFFVGVQFHPQFLSRPQRPHPLFKEFIKAAIHK